MDINYIMTYHRSMVFQKKINNNITLFLSGVCVSILMVHSMNVILKKKKANQTELHHVNYDPKAKQQFLFVSSPSCQYCAEA